MKINYSKSLLTLLAALTLCLGNGRQAVARPEGEPAPNIFYEALSPYGDWIHEDRYGYVWIPQAGADFHPYYTDGYWEMTIYGNTWVSLYPWGWAVFHYGRWTYDPFYGWIWIPGYQWAPAWVCWRYGAGFYGWAPLGPQFIIRVGFGNYGCPDNWWVFTPHHYVYGPRHSTHYRVNTGRERIRASKVVNRVETDRQTNTLYPVGPSAEDIRSATGEQVTIRESNDVTSADRAMPTTTSVRLYRPNFPVAGAARHSAPEKFERAPRPIRADLPVEPQQGSEREYKKEIIRKTPDAADNPIAPRREAEPVRPVRRPDIAVPRRAKPSRPPSRQVEPDRPRRTEPVPSPSQRVRTPRPQRTEPPRPQRAEPAGPQRAEPRLKPTVPVSEPTRPNRKQ